jgi:diguanylate cyclase (GGDEF)-like protein
MELDMMNKNLENLVAERTIELQEVNEELKAKNKELEVLSTTDMLTGIYNRRYIEEQIQISLDRSKRYGQDISIVMVDIDHFKSINDTYGHDIGDKVLVGIARILNENIRKVDVVGRWGGEEFIVLFQEDEPGAFTCAEKLRVKIMGKDHGIAKKITASFGCTQYIENDTIDSLIKRADQGLYKAKENGRNRVETVTVSLTS